MYSSDTLARMTVPIANATLQNMRSAASRRTNADQVLLAKGRFALAARRDFGAKCSRVCGSHRLGTARWGLVAWRTR